ncbi:MAG: pirin family protein [Candidatus Poseidoniaceae archaeon]|jgi:redox-sensitive bicupin YhaK (pirin superfamily)
MSTIRTLRMTAPTHTVLEGGGFPVRRPSAMGTLMSPFLLLDEMGPVHWDPGQAIGAPAHPHRGFETVTYMLQGAMKHEDSAGNKGDLNPGDVQWMTAGRGIIHSELPQDDFLEQGGVTHGFQIWVNLPSKDKMMNPRYQDIPSEQIPKVTSEDGKVWANVIAGSTLGIQAVIDTVIPITYIHMKIQQDGTHRQVIEQGLNGMIYVFGGTVHIDGKPVHDGQLGILTDGDEVVFEARDEDAEFLILAGPELNEPIARYGPFVMNTSEEIQQALQDYQNGTLA